MEEQNSICCPFCGHEESGDYQIMLHLETIHPEGGESPFIVKDDDASVAALIALDDEKSVQYTGCPVDGCGEEVLLTELESHIEMHEEEHDENDSLSARSSKKPKLEQEVEESFDTKLPSALRNLGESEKHPEPEDKRPDKQTLAKAAWRGLLNMPEPQSTSATKQKTSRRRLGKAELGPHASEKQMPSWLIKLLEEDGAFKTIKVEENGKAKKIRWCPNMTAGIMPVLEQLIEQDKGVEFAYLCNPVVKHVSKLRREGGFCGYRNIQMLSSYIIATESQGFEHFNQKIPTIFDIQDYIERAWDLGINAQGRIETGGIRGTRKYIGTPDAQAMFCYLGIACEAQGLKQKSFSKPAYDLLFVAVENYFANECSDYNPKVRCSSLPPIYFQHPGHSMTIVGFEKKYDGTRNLIVFDPMFRDASSITKLIGVKFKHKAPYEALKAYRRGEKYLKKYNEFELLKLTPPPPPINAEDSKA